MTETPQLPPVYLNVPSIIAFNKAIPAEIRDTWIWLRGLCWDVEKRELGQTTSTYTSARMAEIIGKSRQTLYGHMLFLRDRGTLRWAAAEGEGIYVEFPEDGELFTDAPKVYEILDRLLINTLKGVESNNHKETNKAPVQNFVHPGERTRAHKSAPEKETIPAEIMRPMVDMLAHVCRVDKRLVYGRLAKEAKALIVAEYAPEQILQAFGPGSAWYTRHWKGKKGQPPVITDVRVEIFGLLDKDLGGPLSGIRPAADPEDERAETIAHMRAVDAKLKQENHT